MSTVKYIFKFFIIILKQIKFSSEVPIKTRKQFLKDAGFTVYWSRRESCGERAYLKAVQFN